MAFYDATPSYDSGGPMSNYYQSYTFTEKLEPNRIKEDEKNKIYFTDV
jgi:hypothetical protein